MKPNSQSVPTKLSQQISQKTKYIHTTLLGLGCPLVATSITSSTCSSFQLLFQPSDYRLKLIQWLIALLSPGYELDLQYRSCYNEDPHLHWVKRLSIMLWRLGVMPISKFTKNLDYDAYVDGRLGDQSAVNLVWDLTRLAQEKFSARIDYLEDVAADLLGDLTRNHGELVNVSYDPYGVTFPAKYYNKNDPESEKQLKQHYKQMVQQLKTGQFPSTSSTPPTTHQDVFAESDEYRQLFARKYRSLLSSINRMIEKYQKIVPSAAKISQISDLHAQRTLPISKTLSKLYHSYRNCVDSVVGMGTVGVEGVLKGEIEATLGAVRGVNQVSF